MPPTRSPAAYRVAPSSDVAIHEGSVSATDPVARNAPVVGSSSARTTPGEPVPVV